MHLHEAVRKLDDKFGSGKLDADRVANVLIKAGARDDVSDGLLKKVIAAGVTLRSLGVQ